MPNDASESGHLTFEARREDRDRDFDDSQRLVHTDPVLKLLATKFLTCEDHYAGPLTRSDPSALEWAAWDAYNAMLGGRMAGRDGVLANLCDSGFIDIEDPPPCAEEHIDDVLAVVR